MAIVTLRAYLDELQALIEAEALEEVIGHCKYILQTYPKNVAVYRLLGSALLDKARYQEAADIFQRVLSAVPDDMIAHAAMFQIYQESDAFQPATWHLERAFEQNPNSQPLKDELRSLYARRDGAPPERIQMTRGGLARAYFQGQLYEQATAELETILAVEPNRADLLLLLARTYLANNHPVEAGEAALRVLSMLPDALEANALLAQLWLDHQRPSDAAPFVVRVEALDPFLALNILKPEDPTAGEALVLSRLDWNAHATAALLTDTPDWMENMGDMFDASGRPAGSANPFGLERRATAAQPDWMSNFATPSETPVAPSDWFAQAAASTPAAADPFASGTLASNEDVPDWFAEVAANNDQPNRDTNGPPIMGRRNPPEPEPENSAWLQDATDFKSPPPPSKAQHSGFTDLLGEIATARQQDEALPSWAEDEGGSASSGQPDWLNDFSTEASPSALDKSTFGADHPSAIDDLFSNWTPEAATSEASESDWSNADAAKAEPNLTDWMTSFEPAADAAFPLAGSPAPVAQQMESDADNWLSEFNANSDVAGHAPEINDTTDWMRDTASAESVVSWETPAETSGTAANHAEEIWLNGMAGNDSPEAIAEPEAAVVPDWMSALAPSRSSVAEAEPAATDSGDDWLSDLRGVNSAEAMAEPEAALVPDWMSALTPSEAFMAEAEPAATDSGDDWLSDLRGIDSTEAMAEPEAAVVPDWMSALAPSRSPVAEAEPAATDSGDDWLSDLRGIDSAEAMAEPEATVVPDWMSALAPSESPVAEAEPAAADSGDDWLNGLAGNDSAQAMAEPEAAVVPDWMSALAPSESPVAEAEPAVANSGDDWLNGLAGIDSAEAMSEPEAAVVPDWMSALAPPESPVGEAEPAVANSDDDWLSDLRGVDAVEAMAEPEVAVVPDWMSALAPPESPVGEAEAATSDSDDDWLSDLRGVDSAEAMAEPEAAVVPDWMSALDPNTTTKILGAPLEASDDDEWERAFEPDTPTTPLPRPVAVLPIAANEQGNDWLSNVAAQEPSQTENWLSKFAVVENSSELDQAIERPLSPRNPPHDDATLPDWMRDTERAAASESANPSWMRDTERANLPSNNTVDSAAESVDLENTGDYSQSNSTGMTGLLSAMALPKPEPTYSGNNDVLDAQNAPDWMTAFTDETLPELAEPVETQPERYAETVNDALNPQQSVPPARLAAQTPAAAAETILRRPQRLDLSAPVEDEPFDAQAVPDWLSAFAPAENSGGDDVPPEPETEILDLRGVTEPGFDLDSPLNTANAIHFSEADESDEAQVPAWMRDNGPDTDYDLRMKEHPDVQTDVQTDVPVSAEHVAEPLVEAQPAPESEPAGETGGGFTFKRKPAWWTKLKK